MDDAVMPAVDYRQPDGLTWQELETVLRTALSGGGAVGLDVAIFNPRLDPDGTIADRLGECLVRAFDRDGPDRAGPVGPGGQSLWHRCPFRARRSSNPLSRSP
ncbi:arginase family protein [Streptomyces sp. NPDC002788]